MKFKQNSRRQPLVYEKDLVSYWKENKLFEKSVNQRPKDNSYVFYDGPPFITGVPHQGTLLPSIVKDAVPRYWTMKGKRVQRVWGWDCHGLPAEVYTERKLGIQDRRDIGTKVSLEEYITTCRQNMIQTGNEWEHIIDRIGRWVDFQGAYKTMDKDYMESVWWAFKKLYDDGKIYEGEKVLIYCIRDATPISKAEVAMDNSYKDDTDPSVYVKFKLKGSQSYLLAWTTMAWTLLANVAMAVNKDLDYSEVTLEDGQHLILATELLDKALRDERNQPVKYTVKRSLKGKDLVGLEVEPLFDNRGSGAHKVYHENYVGLDKGTGIVQSAPAYGEEDFLMAKAERLPIISVLDDNGIFTYGDWLGQNVWEANKDIAKSLHNKGIVWRIEYFNHSYPHCHRCGAKLIYRAHPSWFLNIDSQREAMLEQNGSINWFPAHIKQGRFAKTVNSAPDWNISRDRFWATAMPVWKGQDKDGKEKVVVVGSYLELEQLSGVRLEDYHRPWVDEVEFEIDGVKYRRVDKVLDCWFESGSMPFAMHHYPFDKIEEFEDNFPGDFVSEYVGQVRAWFYYMHAISVGLFNDRAFNNVVVTGTISGNDGRKMSKSFGNFTDPNELMDRYSADSLRFLFLSSPLLNGEDFAPQDKDVADIYRKLSMIWNMYDFFTLYAGVDGWDSGLKAGELPQDPMPDLSNILDIWIVSKVHQLGQQADKSMEGYDIPNATKPIFKFLDDASNWYVRRSRKRFWKTDNDQDKNDAYRTLHYILVHLSLVMAPFTPFLSEELYRKLTVGESVHLLDWPDSGQINELVVKDMEWARELIKEGLSQRAAADIKLRQPLSKAVVSADREPNKELLAIIAEELNVKSVDYVKDSKDQGISLDVKLTRELKNEGLMREIVRNVQQARKDAGLDVDDRIELYLGSSSDEITTVLIDNQLSEVIKRETLASKFDNTKAKVEADYSKELKVDGHHVFLSLSQIKK